MGPVDRLPESCRPHFSWVMTTKMFDKGIDAFLRAGVQEANSPEFGELLFKLSGLDHAMQEAKAGLIIALEQLRPCKKDRSLVFVDRVLTYLQRANRRLRAF
jgi:hypothetical protein